MAEAVVDEYRENGWTVRPRRHGVGLVAERPDGTSLFGDDVVDLANVLRTRARRGGKS
jgi:hypothetical protein